jgi:hypothetical protein
MGQVALQAGSQLMPSARNTRIRGPGTIRIRAALKNSAGAMIVHNPPCGLGVRGAFAGNAAAGVT